MEFFFIFFYVFADRNRARFSVKG